LAGSVHLPLILAAVILPTAAVHAQALAPAGETANGRLSTQQIYDYAMALAEIERIRKAVADAPADQRPLLAAQAKAAIAAALERRGLDAARFNAISAEVEREHALRDQVRQIMMRDALGA